MDHPNIARVFDSGSDLFGVLDDCP